MLCALLLSWCCAGPARADLGSGMRLGERLTLFPSLGLELRYDSNVFLSNALAPWGLPAQALVLRLMPGLTLTTRPARYKGVEVPARLNMRLHVGLDYREYLTADERLSQHRALGVEVGFYASLFPVSTVSVEVYDHYLRSNQPPYGLLPYNLDRNRNSLGLRLRYGHQQRLTMTLLSELFYDGFEEREGPQAVPLSDFNLIGVNFTLRGAWRILAKMALFLEASQGVQVYLKPAAFEQELSDSMPFRVSGGIIGALTPKLEANLQAGFGHGRYARGPSPQQLLLYTELRYRPISIIQATLGYRHDFANALLANYTEVDALLCSYAHQIRRLLVVLRLAWEQQRFVGTESMLRNGLVCKDGEPNVCVPQLDRNDNQVALELRADLPVKLWFLVGGGYQLTANRSNAYTRIESVVVPATFTRHELSVRTTILY